MHASYLYFAHDRLSPAELSAARLDGHLVELGEGYIPADAIETAGLRAASLATLVGPLLAATHLSAAWVYGALDEPPDIHSVQRAVAHRIHHVLDHRLKYRDGRLGAGELVHIGGIAVTTPVRTLADLARQRGADDPGTRIGSAVARLSAVSGAPRDAIIRLAQHDGAPGKPHALMLLRRLERAATTT